MTVLAFALLGLGTGAVLALLSVGLLVIYRGSGILNLAHGAYAMFTAYFYWQLHQSGLGTIPAMVLGVGVAGLAGFLTDQAVMRQLRRASPLARLIATAGMLLLLQATVAVIWGVVPKTVPSIIPSSAIHLQNATVPSDRLVLFGIAAAVTAAVSAVWRFTRWGWIADAVSEDQRFARSLGWSAESVSAATWSLGCALAGLGGILIAPLTGLDTVSMPLLIVPVLAASLVGGFRSFWLAFLGAALIGVGESLTARYVNVTGAADAIPFAVITVGMIARGSGLPLRGHLADRLPAVGTARVRWPVVLLFGGLAALLVAVVGSADWQAAFAGTFAVAIILLSFVVVVGYTGQLSLAQFTIAGLGALAAARLMYNLHFPFWAALVVGMLAASAVGSVVAIPALRTRGVNLAVITLGMALAAQSMIFNNQTITNAGGATGIELPSLTLFGWSIDPFLHPARFSFVSLGVLVIAGLAVARLRRSSMGRMLLAVRDSERAATSNTVNVFAAKMIGFAVAGALAGLGGILLAFQQSVVQFTAFDPMTGINYLSDAVIGGIGFIAGAMFGAQISPNSIGSVITFHLQRFALYIPLISSLLLLGTLMNLPDGWAPNVLRQLRQLRGKRPRGAPAPSVAPAAAEVATRAGGVAVPQVVPMALRARGVEVRYGGVVAVAGLDLDVLPGTVVGLIGPNGAGKTSFVDAVSGFERASSGSVLLNEVDLTRASAYRRAAAGISRSFQTLELYPAMTVLEHLEAAADRHDLRSVLGGYFGRDGSRAPEVGEILELFGLERFVGRRPDDLPHGTRRMLGVARALATGASVVMVDEPAAGLDADESMRFGEVIRRLARERGMSVLIIEHDMPFVMAVCDRVVVMDGGRKICEGTPAEVQQDAAAIAAYLGDEPVTAGISAAIAQTTVKDRQGDPG
jgi:sulfate-transporting ATPase